MADGVSANDTAMLVGVHIRTIYAILAADEICTVASTEYRAVAGLQKLFRIVLARRGDSIEARRIMVDGKGVGDVSDVVLRDRHQLAYGGMIICVVTIDQTTGEIAGGPELISRGIVQVDQSAELFQSAKEWVVKAISEHSVEARKDSEAMSEAIRVSLRRFFRKQLDRGPVVLPMVLSV